MNFTPDELIRRLDKLSGERANYESFWQDVSKYIKDSDATPMSYEEVVGNPQASKNYANIYFNKILPKYVTNRGVDVNQHSLLAFYSGFRDEYIKAKGDLSKMPKTFTNYLENIYQQSLK